MLLPYATIATAADMSPSVSGSLGQCVSPLSAAFFSKQNMNDIQVALKNRIRCKTGYTIDRQSDEDLVIIMRALYALHSQNVHDPQQITLEVQRLNDLVLADLVPMVAANLAAYLGYLKDASSLPAPLPRGVNTSRRGSDVFSLFPTI